MKASDILMMSGGSWVGDYGYLYNWYAASNALFAPTDWKVPDNTEQTTLINGLGGASVAGGHLKADELIHWDVPNTDFADNSSGFSLFGGGRRDSLSGAFTPLKSIGYIWSNEQYFATDNGYYIGGSTISTTAFNTNRNKGEGISVRLLYTGAGTPTTMTDYDGNVYDVVLIGSQRWIVQNWRCTKLNDGTPLTKVTDNTAWAALTTEGYCASGNDERNVF